MRALLLRHGEAADHAPDGSFNDDARELTPDGIQRLRQACGVYARIIGTPQVILHSPLVRARQSAAILHEEIRHGGAAAIEMRETTELRPSGRPSVVVDQLQAEFLQHSGDVAVVGHEPLLGDLLGLLSTGNDRLGIPLGKGMLAAIRFSNPQVMIGRLITLMSQETATQLS